MHRRWVVALSAMAAGGCASPMDDGSGRGAAAEGRGSGLPRWIIDEWRDEAGREDASAPEHDPASVDALVAWSLEHNPGVRAAEARWRAAAERVEQARTLPQPQLTYRIAVEQIESERDPIAHIIGLAQMFPWFGALELAGQVAAAEAEAAGREYVAAQLSAASAVKEAAAELGYVVAAEEVLREHVEILKRIEVVTRAKVRTATASQRDLVRVQAELDRVDNDLKDIRDMRSSAAARLNAALGRRADAPLPVRIELPEAAADVDEPRLLALVAESNPGLAGLRHTMDARRKSVQLAEKRFGPDITLGVEYGVDAGARMARMERMAGFDDPGEDMLGAMVMVSLPLWRGALEAGRREALAGWAEAVNMYADRRNMIESELKMTLFRLREAERRRVLYGTVLRVRAEQVLASTTTAYRAGEADFTDLVQAQRELLEFELAHERARADRFQRLAQVEAIVGQAVRAANESEVSP